jgi:hypothetical protein
MPSPSFRARPASGQPSLRRRPAFQVASARLRRAAQRTAGKSVRTTCARFPLFTCVATGSGSICRRRRHGSRVCLRTSDGPMNDRAKRIHRARPLHSPEGAMHSQASEPAPRVALKATVGPEGLPSGQAHHAAQNADLRFAPSAALEPATSGLGVRQAPFGWCCPGASPQVGQLVDSSPVMVGRRRL